MTKKTSLFAMTVAGLAASTMVATAAMAKDAKVHCAGVNKCKGKGACKSADNDCKGHNGCKGKGWMDMSEKACTKKGGHVVTEEKKEAAPAPAAPEAKEGEKK